MEAATSAMVAAGVLGVPWSFTSHSSCDPPLMRQKLQSVAFAVSSTTHDREDLVRKFGGIAADKLRVIHGGIQPEEWPQERLGATGPPLLLSVGTLGEKKGHQCLIEACGRLRERGYAFQGEIIGGGPMEGVLREQIGHLSLPGVVRLLGPLPHPEVKLRMARATVFCLACVQAKNGDTDGLPFALMEAMAVGVPVVSTRLVGIPELVEDGMHGFLVGAGDSSALADRIGWLFDHPEEAVRMGMQGRDRVRASFDAAKNTRQLAGLIVGARGGAAN